MREPPLAPHLPTSPFQSRTLLAFARNAFGEAVNNYHLICLHTNTHTHARKFTHKRWSVSVRQGSPQAGVFGAAADHQPRVPHAGKLTRKKEPPGPLRPQGLVLSTEDLRSFLTTVVPMVTLLCWLCFEHSLPSLLSVIPLVFSMCKSRRLDHSELQFL